jgi:hypothetical protein
LKRTQELGLKFDRQFANFVEKERAPISSLQTPNSRSNRTGKSASFMPEEFALE